MPPVAEKETKAESKAEVKQETPKVFEAPKVGIGDIVLWYGHGLRSNGAVPAVVMSVGNSGSLALNLIRPNCPGFESKNGARHMNDPYLDTHYDVKVICGAWELKG